MIAYPILHTVVVQLIRSLGQLQLTATVYGTMQQLVRTIQNTDVAKLNLRINALSHCGIETYLNVFSALQWFLLLSKNR